MVDAFTQADTIRRGRLADMRGVVVAQDPKALKVRVRLGAEDGEHVVTDWLKCEAPSGFLSVYRVPSIGEAVALSAPNGDLRQATVRSGLPNAAFPPVGDHEALTVATFADGTTVFYDARTKALRVLCEGDVIIHAKGALALRADGDLWLDATHIHTFEGGPL